MGANILERLRHRIEVYTKEENKTEFGECTYLYRRNSYIWAEITPVRGKEEAIDGQSVRADVTHKITVRMGAIKEPRNDMYFIYKGQKYEVLYFMPQYRYNDLIIFYCKLILETEEDYNGKD